MVAIALFISNIGITLYTGVSERAFDTLDAHNVEGQGIYFSLLFLWILPAAVLGSIVGASQTEQSIPRILKRFQQELNSHQDLKSCIRLPNECLNDSKNRKFCGGICSWKPAKSRPRDNSFNLQQQSQHSEAQFSLNPRERYAQDVRNDRQQTYRAGLSFFPLYLTPTLLAYVIVILGALISLVLSFLVLDEDHNCRHDAELAILLSWVLSANLNILFKKLFPVDGVPRMFFTRSFENRTILFWTTFAKDIIITTTIVVGITLTHLGIFNRCACYTRFGQAGLTLPQIPSLDTNFQDYFIAWSAVIAVLRRGAHLSSALGHTSRYYAFALRALIRREDKLDVPGRLNFSFGGFKSNLLHKINIDMKEYGFSGHPSILQFLVPRIRRGFMSWQNLANVATHWSQPACSSGPYSDSVPQCVSGPISRSD